MQEEYDFVSLLVHVYKKKLRLIIVLKDRQYPRLRISRVTLC